MKSLRIAVLAMSFVILAVSLSQARSILEKKMWYVSNSGKIAQARFWVIFLGNYDCTLNRNLPGQGMTAIKASMNLQYISSGYIEGNGYGSKGKIDCLPVMLLKNEQGEKKIERDSIDYIYAGGAKVKLLTGEVGDLVIDIEGQKETAKRFVLNEYKLTDYYGEEILKGNAEPEVYLEAISYTKEGAQRAMKASSSK